MTNLRKALDSRRDEFDAHFALAKALEDRIILDNDAFLGDLNLSARHINTVKSGLIVHIYNIEEAIMNQVLEKFGAALGSVDPARWTDHSLREWLREAVVSRVSDGNEDSKIKAVFPSSTYLLRKPDLGSQKLKKPSGTWDDKLIATFARRMAVTFDLPPEMWRRIAKSPEYSDETPLQFLAKRRNAIAHGKRSFEDGASDLELSGIRKLADTTLDYMGYAADAFHAHIENDAHLVPAT